VARARPSPRHGTAREEDGIQALADQAAAGVDAGPGTVFGAANRGASVVARW
jgi:hypothetical protein